MPNTAFLSADQITAPQGLLDTALKYAPPRVAIAQAAAPLPMEAAKQATEMGLMTPLFTGSISDINDQADALSWDISKFTLIEAEGELESGLAAANACGQGQADVLMKGHLHTDMFMRSALNRDAGLRTGSRLVHIFHMTQGNGRALLVSDAAVNVSPDIETRQAAISHCANLLTKLGVDRPKIALLSATESPIPAVPSSMEAQELTEWAKVNLATADVSGPLAMDLIFSSDAAKTKGLGNDPVAGNADAVVVPDIVSGNTLFKTLVYTSGACAAGVVMGAKVPILLTSRADPPAARMASIALAGILNGA